MIQINNHLDAHILQHSVSITQLLGDEKVCLMCTQKEEMGARLWKIFSGLGVCFMLQWLAKFGTKTL